MSDNNTKLILKAINDLREEIIKMDTISKTEVQVMFNDLQVQRDLLLNIDSQSDSNKSITTIKKLTRPMYFKKIFLEDREKYIDMLYSNEILNTYTNHKDVKNAKKDKDNKIASLLYTEHIKNTPEIWKVYEKLFTDNN